MEAELERLAVMRANRLMDDDELASLRAAALERFKHGSQLEVQRTEAQFELGVKRSEAQLELELKRSEAQLQLDLEKSHADSRVEALRKILG